MALLTPSSMTASHPSNLLWYSMSNRVILCMRSYSAQAS